MPPADVPEGDDDFDVRLRWPRAQPDADGAQPNASGAQPDAAGSATTKREAEEGVPERAEWSSQGEHGTDELDPREWTAREVRLERMARAAFPIWLDERLSRINAVLAEAAATSRADLEQAASSHAERLDQMMRAFQTELDHAVDARIADIRETVNAGGAALQQITTHERSELDRSVESARAELEGITARLAELERSVGKRVEELERATSAYTEKREHSTAEEMSQVQSLSTRLRGRTAVALVVCLLAITVAVTALVAVGR